ncbi:MAG: TonB-dependent receptor [Bacteroidales bacterium]|nr:TonB-dependent receptor [Bacteroidales bacterium]
MKRRLLEKGSLWLHSNWNSLLRQGIAMLLALFVSAAYAAGEPGNAREKSGKSAHQQEITVSGVVTDASTNEPLPGVNIMVEGTVKGVVTDIDGKFEISVSPQSVLLVSYMGYLTEKVMVTNETFIEVQLVPDLTVLDEVVVVGYGTARKGNITGSVASVTSKDIERVPAITTSGLLAGKVAGLSYRKAEGRPGSTAEIQVRNMGNPLYIIDGVQKDAGQFNNLAPGDIESISVLKDASATIYGSRAANGVIIVTTKKGRLDSKNTISLNTYYGVQNWTRFPRGVDAYRWQLGKVESDVNEGRAAQLTPEQLELWRQGQKLSDNPAEDYRSFDWYDFIVEKNFPVASLNVNATGGTENTNYYISVSRLNEDGSFKDRNFNRTNIQSNIETKVANRLKFGMQLNGRVETRQQPGIPGHDDYWGPRFALFRNRPTERAYANDNPDYPLNIGHNAEQYSILNYDISGYWKEDWRVMQTVFNAEYDLPVKGLTARGMYSYYFADRLLNGHEYTYDVYTYDHINQEYNITGGSSNPWRERGYRKVIENVTQAQLNYVNTFSNNHNINATMVYERIERKDIEQYQHAVPTANALKLIEFDDMDNLDYRDSEYEEARVGYVGRLNYNYREKYLVTFGGRYDGSWKFPAGKRWGFFPSVSAGWKISGENFFSENVSSSIITDLKFRASYGKLGDDDVGIGAFDHVPGYTYGGGVSTSVYDGQVYYGARNREVTNNLSWYTSIMKNIGADYVLFNGKLDGSIEYFHRLREGLRAQRRDIVLPDELGYPLQQENLEKDQVSGWETLLNYHTKIGELKVDIGTNFGYARRKWIESYKPEFDNSLDYYRHGSEGRYTDIIWGYQVIGQFQSMDEIRAYEVEIDNNGNRSLLPGDFIYKDVNGDKKIDSKDERPIGYGAVRTPLMNFGLNTAFSWKNFDAYIDFSGAAGYTYIADWEMRWPYQNGGNLLEGMFESRWHRADPYDINSEWIAGDNPPLRFNNGGHSNYNKNSDWWSTNVRYLRLRTFEVGYSLPKTFLNRIKMQQFRIYANSYNLFSFDNLKKKYNIDPEIGDGNGLQYPQHRIFNLGLNVTF